MKRRTFLKSAGATLAASALTARAVPGMENDMSETQKRYRKAIILGMVAGDGSVLEKFELARKCGFDGLEVAPPGSPEALEELKAAGRQTGLVIHSLIYGGWGNPLSHSDKEVQKKGRQELETAMRSAHELGADGVLLVPGIVNKQTRYVDAYERSQKNIRQLIPLAEDLGVRINIEEVWNKFLLSPLEFAQYVDEFESPMVQAYFDVGNVIDFGWPEDWIRTLGNRTVKIHLKDFRRDGRQWVPLGEGDADYPEVMRALDEVEYSGWLTCELPAGDEAYLMDVSRRVDRIIAGENPAPQG